MKNEVSSLELRHLTAELNAFLTGSRIDKVYQPGARTFLFVIRKVGEEKRLLRIELPKFLYLSSYKEEMPERLTGFCGFLRKYVEGKAIESVEQVGMERILRIPLATKEESLVIYLELFGKGNFIVCEEDNTILGCLEPVVYQDRIIKPGAIYEVPEREHLVEKLTLEQFTDLINASAENVSTALAVDLGMGGLFAQELCSLSGVAPGKKASAADIEKLYLAFQNVLKRKPSPLLALRKDMPEEVILFPMRSFEKDTLVPLKSLSEGLDKLFARRAAEHPAPKKDKKLAKLQTIITMQEQNATKLEAQADEEQKKGEFIYERYQDVKKILEELQLQMKHHSLQELQEKLKGHKTVKEIKAKEGTVVLEF
ncbi:MAG TPA: NFACT family protein [Candidatus Binatia bacterium]|nr:NFACT family protein [Candidatus Binatia bacterium]